MNIACNRNMSQPISHQRLDHHEMNCLYHNIYQHLGYSVHMTRRIGADRCFAGCFDTDDECDAFCKELKQIHVTAVRGLDRIHRCRLYPLPTAETKDKPKCKRRELERWPLQMSLSYIIFREGVRGSALIKHHMYTSTINERFLV